MAQESGRESRERDRHVQHAEHQSPHALGPGGLAVLVGQPALGAGSLLSAARLSGRGNQPVKIAMMRQAQRTYGNRAIQRFLQSQQVGPAAQATGPTQQVYSSRCRDATAAATAAAATLTAQSASLPVQRTRDMTLLGRTESPPTHTAAALYNASPDGGPNGTSDPARYRQWVEANLDRFVGEAQQHIQTRLEQVSSGSLPQSALGPSGGHDEEWAQHVVQALTGQSYENAHQLHGGPDAWRREYQQTGRYPVTSVCDQLGELIQHVRGLQGYGGGLTAHYEYYDNHGAFFDHESASEVNPGSTVFYTDPSGTTDVLSVDPWARMPRRIGSGARSSLSRQRSEIERELRQLQPRPQAGRGSRGRGTGQGAQPVNTGGPSEEAAARIAALEQQRRQVLNQLYDPTLKLKHESTVIRSTTQRGQPMVQKFDFIRQVAQEGTGWQAVRGSAGHWAYMPTGQMRYLSTPRSRAEVVISYQGRELRRFDASGTDQSLQSMPTSRYLWALSGTPYTDVLDVEVIVSTLPPSEQQVLRIHEGDRQGAWAMDRITRRGVPTDEQRASRQRTGGRGRGATAQPAAQRVVQRLARPIMENKPVSAAGTRNHHGRAPPVRSSDVQRTIWKMGALGPAVSVQRQGPVARDPDCPPRRPGELARVRTRPMEVNIIDSPYHGLLIANFASGSARVKSDLERNSRWAPFWGSMVTNPNRRWRILGFSDCHGREGENELLRWQRAMAVNNLLPLHARQQVDSFAAAPMSQYLDDNSSEEGRTNNRSVVILLASETMEIPPERVEGRLRPEACFDGTTIRVNKNGRSHSCAAITGTVGAPTPQGRFCIRRQGEAQRRGGWRGLFQDRSRWYLLEPQFATTRSRMQLHPGMMSAGCTTVTDTGCFDRLAAILNSGGTVSGRGYDGYPPGNAEGVTNPERSVTCVGWLIVTSSGGCQ